MACWRSILIALALTPFSTSSPIDGRYEIPDLDTFVTRPDIRPPKFNVTIYDENALESGYWFTAPYVDLKTRDPSSKFVPAQVGPHIYDNHGNLVYDGSHLVSERTSFDFRAVPINGSDHLTLLVDRDDTRRGFRAGAGLIFDSNFGLVGSVQNLVGSGSMNMHEFNIVDDGNKALTITFNPQMFDHSHGKGEGPYGWIGNNGFQEFDLTTGKVSFTWWALDFIAPEDSFVPEKNGPGTSKGVWDWFHMNSVDKNAEGDYLVSARYTNAIYKISGKDGHIIWQLGGKKSSFKQHDFDFSMQHDARFRRQNSTHTVISFLDNASNGIRRTSETSAALVIALNTETMEATVVQKIERPDGELTKLRGNVQEMPNGNYFVCWSENGHISEHTADGKLLMEAQFASKRFVSYRGAKFQFTGRPVWAPVAKGFAYGAKPETSTTTMYVSWNGATEVHRWRFWGSARRTASLNDFKPMGEIKKEGFESMFMTTGFIPYIYVEALSVDGKSLGHTPVTNVEVPKQWQDSNKASVSRIQPHTTTADIYSSILRDPPSPTGKSSDGVKSLLPWPTAVMTSEQVSAVAIYIWVVTAVYAIGHICVRHILRSRRKVPWIKSQI